MQPSGTTSPRELLVQATERLTPARALSPERYAATHSVYEAFSNQRAMVRAWMIANVPAFLPPVDGRPVRVLGVGVGDGSVDVPLAERLIVDRAQVDYHAVEPHGPSLERCLERMAAVSGPRLTVTGSPTDLAGYAGDGPFDVVHFVHSLYYVPDLGEAIDHAVRLLRPGGRLITLISPLEPLSLLSSLLAPQPDHPHWFADAVDRALTTRGLAIDRLLIDSRLDLTPLREDPDGVGEQVLDFLLQCRATDLPPTVRGLVDDYLADIALPDDPDAVPHPLQAFVATVTDASG
jgi:SAM-dependent methyltransferase